MKILIIEDNRSMASLMKEALVGLGEITLCSPPSLEEVNFKLDLAVMPPQEEAVSLIGKADLILLDQDLSTDYTGEDLLPYCNRKKVISVSSEHSFGKPHFTGKNHLDASRPHVAASLRDLVSKIISE